MTHTIELTDEQYALVAQAAERQGVTSVEYVIGHAQTDLQPHGGYDNLDDFFHSLGALEEQIKQSELRYRRTDWNVDWDEAAGESADADV